ncbi:hypothetical protein FC16_GL000920 [Loigolactobacillus coryniformis subsp. torquens DSM 20004 = KCTC 3535]|nr:hypothetical protein FC16_GL000920 [Loigolactobacillus coryniformis subsp. torquens DSM 20004 = KCTC 3535]
MLLSASSYYLLGLFCLLKEKIYFYDNDYWFNRLLTVIITMMLARRVVKSWDIVMGNVMN